MGGIWDSFKEGSKQIGEVLGYDSVVGDSNRTQRKRRAAIEASRPRKAPTLDDAVLKQQEEDRLNRKRGVLTNVYAGNTSPAPTVAVKKLLG